MSCALTAGYALGCRNSVGGVYSLSLANFNPTGSVTTNGSGTVTWLNGYGLENLLLQSNNLSTASWTKAGSATVSGNYATAPDGTTTASRVSFVSGASSTDVTQTFALTSGTTYTASFFLKNENFSGSQYVLIFIYNASGSCYLTIRPASQTVVSMSYNVSGNFVSAPTYKSENYGNGWYRYSITFTPTGAFNGTTSFINYSDGAGLAGNANRQCLIWGCQVERSDYAGYVVQTTTASASVNYPFFKYELPRNTASIVQTKQASTENGTLFYQQDLNFVENKLSIGLRNEFRRLAETKSIAIVADRNGNKWILGSDTGLELTAGNAQTGINQGDRNGYDITLTGLESYPMMVVQEGLATPSNEGIEGYLPDGQRTQSSGKGTPGAALPFVPEPG